MTLTFDGVTYDPAQDRVRLRSQLYRVFSLMSDGSERTLAELAQLTGGTEASCSARLRDLRKPRFGAWDVNRRRMSGGLFAYRLVQREATND
jgi:hypothetical protein